MLHGPPRVVTVEPWLPSSAGPAGGQASGAAEVAARLRDRPHLAWLDSALPMAGLGRWSVVASDPRWTLTAHGGDVLLEDAAGPHRLAPGALRAFLAALEAEPPVALPAGAPRLPFAGGAIGYLGFELGREIEALPATTVDDVGAPDLAMSWYDAALAWDHEASAGWLVGRPEAVCALRARLATPASERLPVAPSATGAPRANMVRERYLDSVERAKRYIEAGDIYQVNLSQRFSAPVAAEGFDLYRRLRRLSPAPFAAYLDASSPFGAVEVLSSSPERLLLADGAHLETRPIKGTRRRGGTPAEDARMAEALLASAKDRAEHVMIVDLERNDLGRVSEIGSVRVPALAALETFAQVHHMTSTVTGRRRAGAGAGDLLRAVFPGGSISGAPKIRALEIIDELEPTVRGVYTGALGYVSAHGRIDLNVAIRTITLADGVAHMHVGGAIVHDSDAEAEYQETLDKARGMARALGVALPDEAGTAVDSPAGGPVHVGR